MSKFEPVNSIEYKCEADDLKHGQHLWAVLIVTEGKRNKKESLSVVPCVVIRRHDDRDDKGWHVMYDLKFPVVKGLTIEWQTLWSRTNILFHTKEDALIAAEAYMRDKLKEDADFIEKITEDDTSWDIDENEGACAIGD